MESAVVLEAVQRSMGAILVQEVQGLRIRDLLVAHYQVALAQEAEGQAQSVGLGLVAIAVVVETEYLQVLQGQALLDLVAEVVVLMALAHKWLVLAVLAAVAVAVAVQTQ
jgi:predicted DCC family thiol-disulfide oxidoreductase YuxK